MNRPPQFVHGMLIYMEPIDLKRPPWRQRTIFHVGFVLVILLLGSAFSLHHGLRSGRYALMAEKVRQGRYLCERIALELQKSSPDLHALFERQAEGPLGIGRVKAIWYYRGGASVLEMAAEGIPPLPDKVIRRLLDDPVSQNIPRRNWAYLITYPLGNPGEGHFLVIHLDGWVPLKALIPYIPHPDWPLWGLVALLLGAYAIIIHSMINSKKT